MRGSSTAVLVGTVLAFGDLAAAADLPVKNRVLDRSSGLYFSLDGAFESVALPAFGLGLNRDTLAGFSAGPFETYKPRPTGIGAAVALGYGLPHGTFGPALGAEQRIEFGAAYVDASARQAGAGPANGTPGALWQSLNGFMAVDNNCFAPCTTTSTLDTHYTSWNVHLTFAADHHLGALDVTPSLQVFGGQSRSRETFSQQFFVGGAGGVDSFYNALATTRWNDVGAKLALATGYHITPALSVGLAGSVGSAYRSVSLAASDVCGCAGFVVAPSAISVGDRVTPFLGNAEASLTYKPTASVSLRGFGGLSYDSSVPGIAAPTHSGPVAIGTFGTPAGLTYEGLTSWYAGGGLVVAFAP